MYHFFKQGTALLLLFALLLESCSPLGIGKPALTPNMPSSRSTYVQQPNNVLSNKN